MSSRCVHIFACVFFRVKKETAAHQEDVEAFYLSRNSAATVIELARLALPPPGTSPVLALTYGKEPSKHHRYLFCNVPTRSGRSHDPLAVSSDNVGQEHTRPHTQNLIGASLEMPCTIFACFLCSGFLAVARRQ